LGGGGEGADGGVSEAAGKWDRMGVGGGGEEEVGHAAKVVVETGVGA